MLTGKRGKSNMDARTLYWVELAEYDFETAKVLLETQRYLYVGFMLHQTIEKVLKGYFVAQFKESPPYTHSLIKLAQSCSLLEALSESQKDLLDVLEPLNLEARYPDHKERLLKHLSSERCRILLLETEELFQWINAKL